RDNQRYDCNKRKSDGVLIVYEPHPGFAGSDSVTLDTISPRGQETKQRFSIAVGGNPSALVATESPRVVALDHKIEIDFIYAINADCSSVGLPIVRVLEQPRNGNVAVENGTGFSNFAADNQRYECNKRKSEGVSVVYDPRPGFTGTDSIELDIIFPRG